MRRSFLGSLIASIFTGLLLLVSPGTGYGQQTQFTVNIPQRPGAGNLPISLVTIQLTVPGATSATSTLEVTRTGFPSESRTGVNALTPGGFFQPLEPLEPTKRDAVLFQVNAANNRVTIQIHPYETLRADPGDLTQTQLCVVNTSPVPPNPDVWTFTYHGPVNATGYRFTSYTELSEVQCSCDKRRLGDMNNGAQITMQAGVSLLGRLPIDLILVLDKSGSMSEAIPSTADTKMPALKWAVSQLIDFWRSENGSDKDRLAIVLFDTLVTVQGTGFVTRDTPSGWEALRDAVNSPTLTPGGDTAMGDGISKAIEIYKASAAADKNRDAFIILLTDGMQNEGNLIKLGSEVMPPPVPALVPNAMAFFETGIVPGTTPGYKTLFQECIPVQTVGVGAPGGSFTALLNQISDETGGGHHINLGSGMDIAMKNSMIDSLKGNTLSNIVELDTSLNAGASASTPAPFEISSSVKRAILILGWRNPAAGLELQINPPGGGAPVTPAERHDDPLGFYTVQSVDLPANGPPGQWSATVKRAAGNTVATPYHLSVVAVEGRLSFQMSFGKTDYGTGEAIILSASMGDNGTPITGLGNALTVRVDRPQTALGTFLRQAVVPTSVLTTNPPGHSADAFPNPYARKLFSLMQDPGFLARLEPKQDPRTFTLFDDGNPVNGDAIAGDGIYSIKFSDTQTPGLYRFRLAMNFDRSTTGKINRVEERETEVRVKVADPNETEIAATKALTPGEYRLDITPADVFKNFMGPGYADRIKVTLAGGGTLAGPPVDERENGTYTLRVVGIPAGANPTATVVINGKTVKSTTLSQFTKPNKKFAVFASMGGNFPHGNFNNLFDPGVSVQAGLEYRFNFRVSAEGAFGYDRFNLSSSNFHLGLYRGSANLKVYPVIGVFQLGVFGGGGVYHFNPGDTRFGLNIGFVPEYRINTNLSIEAPYSFHNVFTPGGNVRFSTLQGGVRIRF
jgi:hypothetical protein